MAVSIKVRRGALEAAAKELWADQIADRLQDAIERGMKKGGAKIARAAKQRAPVRSGALRRAISFIVGESKAGHTVLSVGIVSKEGGKPLAYAKVRDVGTAHLPGGVIRSKRMGGQLAIPMKRTRVMRYKKTKGMKKGVWAKAGERSTGLVTKSNVGGIRARDVWKDPEAYGFLRTHVSQSGGAIMGVFDTGKRGPRGGKRLAMQALFALKDEVKQKGNRYLTGAIEEGMDEVRGYIAEAVGKELKKIGSELSKAGS